MMKNSISTISHVLTLFIAVLICAGLSALPGWCGGAERLNELGRWGGDVNSAIATPNAIVIGEGGKVVWLDPANPSKPLGFLILESPHVVLRVESGEGLIYAAQIDRISVIDGADPSRPRLITQLATARTADMQVEGGCLWLMNLSGGISVYDLQAKQGNPMFMGAVALPDPDEIWFMRVRGGILFIGRGDRVDMFDVADLSNVQPLGALTHGFASYDVDFDGTTAAVVGGNFLSAWDISDPAMPQLIDAVNAAQATRIVSGNGAWFINYPGTLVQEWLLEGGAWTLKTQIDGGLTAPDIRSYRLAGQRILIAAGRDGLRVVDISQLNNPIVPSVFNMPNFPNDAALDLNRLVVVDRNEGLLVFDFTNPALPQWLGEHPSNIMFKSVDLAGSIATVASAQGLRTFSIADPSAIQPLDEYNPVQSFHDVAVRGNFAYATETSFRVLDITDPGNITPVSEAMHFMNPEQVELMDEYVIVKAREYNIFIFDISMAPMATEVSQISGGSISRPFAVRSPYLYFRDQWAGYNTGTLYDISDPANPTTIETVSRIHQYPVFVQNYWVFVGQESLPGFPRVDRYNLFSVDMREGIHAPPVGAADWTMFEGYFPSNDLRITTVGGNVVCVMMPAGLWLYSTDAFDFSFDRNPDAWPWQAANAVPALTSPNFARAAGSLQIRATDNAANFGWWQMPGGIIPVVPGQLARIEWTVSSDQSDAALVPTFRMRASRGNLQQFDVLTINASGAADLAPAPGPRTFTQIVDSQPGATVDGADNLVLAFDLLGFDPARSPSATLRLEKVVIDSFAHNSLPAPQPIAAWNFDTGVEGWSLITASPFPPASGFWQSGALRLQSSEFLSFGSWVSSFSAAMAQPGDLVRARFNVAATSASKEVLPTFRARFLSDDAQFAIEKGFNSVGDGALGPSLQGDNYDIFTIIPAALNGGASVPITFGFDLLHFDPADQTFAGLDLLGVRLDRFQPIPLLAPDDGEAHEKE